MGRNAWEAELEGAGGKRSGGSKLGRFFVAVLVVGGATFVAAYYVPLLRAHRVLTGLYGQTKDRAQTSEQKAAHLEADLKTAMTERDAFKEQESKRDSDAQSGRQRIDTLASDLSEKLKKHFDKGRLKLSTANDRVRLGASREALFVTGKDDLSPTGVLFLCDIAKATGSRPLRVAAPMAGGTPPAGASKPAWESRAADAARVAQALADKCAVPAARLSLTVLAGEEPPHSGAHETQDGVTLALGAD